jgi:hypothetical protein
LKKLIYALCFALPSLPVSAVAESLAAGAFVRAVDHMMTGLAGQNAEASTRIRETYQEYLELLVLDGYADLEDALWTGGLAPLPGDPLRFNIIARTEGEHPIGEKDLANQAAYLAARPATIGALLEVASRVTSGPIEVTSLVRHSDYQDELRETNVNANTAVPMHTMGLAFDIALVNTPFERIQEIRRVLEAMRDDGDILFIGERRQLVFHVVPQPSRLGHFTELYTRAFMPPAVAARPLPVDITAAPSVVRASVVADVVDVRPTEEHAAAWWSAMETEPDATVRVTRPLPRPGPPPAASPSPWWAGGAWIGGFAVVLAALRQR